MLSKEDRCAQVLKIQGRPIYTFIIDDLYEYVLICVCL